VGRKAGPRRQTLTQGGDILLDHGVRPLLAGLLLALSLLTPGPLRAAFDFNDSDWEGSSELLKVARDALGADRVEITASLDWERLTPSDALLVLHPTSELDYDEVSAFLRAGGRLALLDDYGKGVALLERFQIRRIPAPLRPASTLRQNSGIAIAIPAVQQVAGIEQGRHPVVADVAQLVTNHPTALTHPNLTPVLEIAAIGEPNATLAVTGIIVNRGRLFAMGDPSATINLMMRYPGNRAFAKGLVEYLVEDDAWGQRGGKLYLLANDFRQKGAYGGGTSFSRDLREQFEGLSEMIAEMREDGLPDLLAVVLAMLAGLAVVLWTGVVSTRPYRRSTPRYAAAQPLVAQGGVAGRAAVLAAPTTHPALALLELKSALEEGLALRLDLPPNTGTKLLLEEIDGRGLLSKRSYEDLVTILNELKRAEMAVATAQPLRVPRGRIERLRDRVLAVLAEVDEHKAGRRSEE
jgi:hypothetical protein